MSFTVSPAIADRVDAVFRDAGLDGWLHVLDIDSGAEISVRGDEVRDSLSTAKVAILVALMRAAAAGSVALDEQIDVPADGRTYGDTGLSTLTYPARLALGDLAHLMIALSDNHATDLVLERVTPAEVTAVMRELGLTVTTLETTVGEFFAGVQAAAAEGGSLSEVGRRPESAGWRTTPAEMCRLLGAIWRDEAAPPELCERMRAIMRSCLTTHGLDCELPLMAQASSGRKTGSFFAAEGAGEDSDVVVVRGEVGVVGVADGRRYAVAVFTRAEGKGLRYRDPSAGRALGTAVRVAIDSLREAT